MNTPDTLAILVIQDTGQRLTKQNKENHTENYKDRHSNCLISQAHVLTPGFFGEFRVAYLYSFLCDFLCFVLLVFVLCLV
jgi:hypothetical protein